MAHPDTEDKRQILYLQETLTISRRRDTLLQAIATMAELALRSPVGHEPLVAMMKVLGEASNFSRVYVFQNHTAADGRLLMSQRFEWTATNVHPELDNPALQNLAYDDYFPRWAQLLAQDESIAGLVRDFPASEQAILAPQHIISIAVVPIYVNEQWWGFIGFDECQREYKFTPTELDVLRAAANIFGATLRRRQMDAALQASERRYRTLVETVQDIVFHTDTQGRWTFLNTAWEQVMGYPADDVLGHPFSDYVYPDDRPAALQHFHRLLHGVKQHVTHESRYVTRDNEVRWFEVRAHIAQGDGGRMQGTVGVLRDVTERKSHLVEIERLAYDDQLTGLANRRRLYDYGNEVMQRIGETFSSVALLYLDLNNFKQVNDWLGHDAGDELLRQAATRLRGCLRDNDLLARLGGDEFAIMLMPASEHEADLVAWRVARVLEQPYLLHGTEVESSASIGVALSSDPAMAFSTLLTRADIAMYNAKRSGRADGRVKIYNTTLTRMFNDRVSLEKDFRGALVSDQLVVHYQPIIPLHPHGGGLGQPNREWCEGLVRWQHPHNGLYLPPAFLSLAHDMGLMRALDAWVTQRVLAEAAHWHEQGHPRTVSINLSTASLNAAHLTKDLANLLRVLGVPPSSVVIEMSETVPASSELHIANTLQELRQMGLKVAIDNFGSGTGALMSLLHLPLDMIKLSPSLVSSLTTRGSAQVMVQHIIATGNALGIEVVAVGVRSREVLAWLRAAGCHHAQGYLLGLPQPDLDSTSWQVSL